MSKHMELTTMQWVSLLVCTAWNLFISKKPADKRLPPNSWNYTRSIFFLCVSIACSDQGSPLIEKFSELDGWVFLFPIIFATLSWNDHNCSISMSCGISSSFSSFRMRVRSHSVRFPQPIWRFQRGSHQLQMPRCFSSAWWLSSPHKDLEGL